MEFKSAFAEDYCIQVTDGTHDSPRNTMEGYKLITSRHLKEFGLDFENSKNISESDYLKINKRSQVDQFDILFSMIGTVGRVYLEREPSTKYAIKNVGLFKNYSELNAKWLYYFLQSSSAKDYIHQHLRGSTQQYIPLTSLRKFPIIYPSNRNDMFKIVNMLDYIDRKRENNFKIITNLEELSQVLFKRWFVDFEFPNENGTPYKSNNGIMKESVLGKIPNDWNVSALENIAENYNSLRKPLSKLEREKQENNFPYYGATKVIDYVEDYIFDGKYILVGEDGTVITNKKSPYTQYVSGKFWVSNHAHILKGKEMSDELLLLNLNNINISPFITGAVQPKLNKKNLNSIRIVKAPKNTQNQFEKVIEPIFEKIRSLKDEIIYLTQLRDTLLPKLMSGEIELPDTLEVTEDAELLQRG